jgi:LuxR family maltose regulon positive regulatory protein
VAAGTPGLLAAAYAERHRYGEAAEALERAAAARAAFGVERVPQAAMGSWSAARALLLLGRLEEAETAAQAAVAATAGIPAAHDSTMIVPPCLIHLAQVRIAQDRAADAIELLAEARRRLAFAPDPARLAGWLDEAERACATRLQGISGIAPPTQRELVVLQLLAGAQSLREIAAELGVSENTVKTQAKSLYRKLGVGSRHEAVARGRELRMIASHS